MWENEVDEENEVDGKWENEVDEKNEVDGEWENEVVGSFDIFSNIFDGIFT